MHGKYVSLKIKYLFITWYIAYMSPIAFYAVANLKRSEKQNI